MRENVTKLNLGAGKSSLPGYISLDVEASTRPNRVCDFTKERLPFDINTLNEVVLFHTIEHIEKKYHRFVLSEIHRVLKPDGVAIISYPEFGRCAQNWINNHRGQRDFWEHTIYGLQRYSSDFHVCA